MDTGVLKGWAPACLASIAICPPAFFPARAVGDEVVGGGVKLVRRNFYFSGAVVVVFDIDDGVVFWQNVFDGVGPFDDDDIIWVFDVFF